MGRSWARGSRQSFLKHRLPDYADAKANGTTSAFLAKTYTEWFTVFDVTPHDQEPDPLPLPTAPDGAELDAYAAKSLEGLSPEELVQREMTIKAIKFVS